MHNKLLSFIKSIPMDNKNDYELDQLFEYIHKKGGSNLREIFDINSHEFKDFDENSRIEIIRYFLTFQESETDKDMIGTALWDVIDQYCDTFNKSIDEMDTENLLLHIAEYLLR